MMYLLILDSTKANNMLETKAIVIAICCQRICRAVVIWDGRLWYFMTLAVVISADNGN